MLYTVHVAYLIVLTILSVPVCALNVDLAWSLSLDNVYKGSEMKQVLLHVHACNYNSTIIDSDLCGHCFHFANLFWRSDV